MKTLNPDLPVVLVGGRAPLYQKQGTAGFDRKGNYLGEFDDQSEPLELPESNESSEGSEGSEQNPNGDTGNSNETGDQGGSESAPQDNQVPAKQGAAPTDPVSDPEQSQSEPAPEPAPEPTYEPEPQAAEQAEATETKPESAYAGKQAKTLKRLLEDRGLEFEPDADRDALVALLEADDKKSASK